MSSQDLCVHVLYEFLTKRPEKNGHYSFDANVYIALRLNDKMECATFKYIYGGSTMEMKEFTHFLLFFSTITGCGTSAGAVICKRDCVLSCLCIFC